MGNGRQISFWKDYWVGVAPLNSSEQNNETDLKVKDFIDSSGGWNENLLSNVVPNDKLNEILNVPLPISTTLEDSIAWVGSGSGKFSVGNCYHQIIKKKASLTNAQHGWKWLWKKKLRSRIIHFLWLVRQRKILTNKACMRRGIGQDYQCKSCSQQEDESHIFKDCFTAISIWNKINPSFLESSGDISFELQLDKNLKDQVSGTTTNLNWSTLFVATIWNIWKGRNDFQFNDVSINPDQIVIKSRMLAFDIFKAFNSKDIWSD